MRESSQLTTKGRSTFDTLNFGAAFWREFHRTVPLISANNRVSSLEKPPNRVRMNLAGFFEYGHATFKGVLMGINREFE